MWLRKLKNLFSSNAANARARMGKIKFFNKRRGYGFIETETLENDVFVHVTELEDFVSRGDRVAFEVEPSDKGLEAKNVRLVKA